MKLLQKLDKAETVDAVVFGVLSFIFFVNLTTSLGFLIGITVSHFHLPLAVVLTMGALWVVAKQPLRAAGIVFGLLFVTVALSMLPVNYAFSDGDAYHRAGSIMLANGWNPVRECKLDYFDANWSGLRLWHIAFIPRGVWIYGAVLYRCFGFVEVVDSINLLAFIVVLPSAWRWIANILPYSSRWMRAICVAMIMVSPYTLPWFFGGVNDGVIYCLVLLILFLTDEYARTRSRVPLAEIVMACVIISGCKFTGFVVSGSIFVFSVLVFCCAKRWNLLRTWVVAGISTLFLILLIHASPYVTSSINYASPFYPAHTFDKSLAVEDPITGDFDEMNDDERCIGAVGRFARAYISETLTDSYYRWRLKKPDFNPQMKCFNDVGGLGVVFRIAFVLSLIAMLFIRNAPVRWIMLYLLLTFLLPPAPKFTGYARYICWIYALPCFAIVGLLAKWQKLFVKVLCAVLGLVYMAALVGPQLVTLPYIWVTSVQNLQVINAVKEDPWAVITTESLNMRAVWSHDNLVKAEVMPKPSDKLKEERQPYGPLSRRYNYWRKGAMPADYYSYAFKDVGYHPEQMGDRRAGVSAFFLKEFLPGELKSWPRRLGQVVSLRARQFVHAWTEWGDVDYRNK